MTLQMQFPRIKLWWIRGRDRGFFKFRRPVTMLGLGPKDTGKSALLETVAVHYPKIIDLWGSRDSEGLAWCRSPFKDSVLFIVGDSVDVKSQWDTVRISDLKLSDFRKYKVVLSVSAFYPSITGEFHAMNRIVNVLYRRTWWKEVWLLMVREGANFMYSRLKIAPSQTLAKADFLYLGREARHMGYAVGIDTIRWTGVDADIRGVSDYFFVKAVGIEGLPYDLRWLYGLITPYSFMNPHPRVFVLVSRRGPVALGTFEEPQWHKKEGENMTKLLDIDIEYGDIPDYGNASRNTVSDFEHAKIVAEYYKIKSMQKVAKRLSRSPGTVNRHITEHDEGIGKVGYCLRCRRVKGEFATTPALKDLRPSSGTYQTWEEFKKTF